MEGMDRRDFGLPIYMEAKRKYVKLSEEKRAQIKRWQEQVKEELPELAMRLQMYQDAAKGSTVSCAIRRAIHTHGLSLILIAKRCEIGADELDDFLIGERTLPSSVIDRLADVLGLELMTAKTSQQTHQ